MEEKILARFEHMRKYFGVTKAVDDVTITVERGEIRGLIGENGSGKSTFLSMVAGILKPDSGAMTLSGKHYAPKDLTDATRSGVSMIVQEINTLPGLTVAENIFLGREELYTRYGVRNLRKLNRMASKVLEEGGMQAIQPGDDIGMYSTEQRKMIELLRAADTKPELLMIDETTTALSQTGRDQLYKLMRETKQRGSSVMFISHDLQEVLSICDTVTVMRDGHYIGTVSTAEVTESDLKRMMVGRELLGQYYREDFTCSHGDEVVVETRALSESGKFQDINIQLHKGEILGFGGLSEAGMHEVAKAIWGIEQNTHGDVLVGGRQVSCIQDRIDRKMAYLPKNRDSESLFNKASILDNICIASFKQFAPSGIVTGRSMRKNAETYAGQLNVKMNHVDQFVGALSGGNKQKVVVAKWLAADAEIFIMDSPTRGIDVAVKAVIYNLMNQLKQSGKSILIISEELTELIGMCDRICIFKDGKIVKEFPRSEDLTEQDLIHYMV